MKQVVQLPAIMWLKALPTLHEGAIPDIDTAHMMGAREFDVFRDNGGEPRTRLMALEVGRLMVGRHGCVPLNKSQLLSGDI
jgi:hypothetical protein